MYQILHQGIDTLDISIQGALPLPILDELEAARTAAEALSNDKIGVPVRLGSNKRLFFVKAHGKKGGYRYTLTDDPTGAIYSVKRETRPQMWNFFVSARAAGLLCRGYEGMKEHIQNALEDMGATLRSVSVNRLDYAIDIAACDFDLRMDNFIAPRRAKVSSHIKCDHELDDFGNTVAQPTSKQQPAAEGVSSVMRGGGTIFHLLAT